MPKWVDEGDNLVAEIMFGTGSVPGTYYVGLYKDGSEPLDDATLATITEESGSGYARQPLVKDTDWTIVDDLATGDEVTFTATGAWGNDYGYFICDVASGTAGNLLVVEDFSDGPYNVGSGDSVRVTCKIRVQ